MEKWKKKKTRKSEDALYITSFDIGDKLYSNSPCARIKHSLWYPLLSDHTQQE